jgi:maltose alpha-D-glucosyltransferase/alpha-amylase
MQATAPRPATAQWGLFLRNHDELDLGRLKPAQRQAVFNAFAPDKTMQLYGRGIRRRLAPMLEGDRRRMEMAYSLMLTLPGTPVIRYGDEIGMGDDLALPERNCARTPMQWSSEKMGGFTESDHPIRPPVSAGAYGFRHVNVSAQRRDPDSFLNWTERVLRMRKELPEIGWGAFSLVKTAQDNVLAVRYTWRESTVLIIHNLSAVPGEVRFNLGAGDPENGFLVNLLSDDHSTAIGGGKHCILLEPYGYRWFRVGGKDHLLHRAPDEAVRK